MSTAIEASGAGSQADRRVSPRVAARFRAELFCLGGSGAPVARSSDIGPGGVCIETESAFDASSLRRISIELPDGPVQAKAVARWQRRNNAETGFLTGVDFRDLAPNATKALLRFVHDRAEELSGFLLQRSEVEGLQLDEALDLALFTRVAEFPRDNRIYEQGTLGVRGDSIYVVFDGDILLEAIAPGGTPVRIEQVGMGGVIGGLPLLAETAHTESAIAVADTRLLEIDPHTFDYLQSVKPSVAGRLRTAVIRKRAHHLRLLIERVA